MSIWRDWNEADVGCQLRSLSVARLRADRVAAVIHIENVSQARNISKYNQNRGFTVLDAEDIENSDDEEDGKTTDTDSQLTPNPSSPSGCYIMLDKPPGNVYRKRKANLTGSEYLFGRDDAADILLAKKTSRAKVSLQQFALRLYKDIWVIEHLARSGTSVNNFLLRERGSMIALHPSKRNIVKVPGDLSIHIYCGDPMRLDYVGELQHPMDQLLMSALDIQSCIGASTEATELESTNSEGPFLPNGVEPNLYILWDNPINGHNNTRIYRALDPWTFQHKVVKLCEFEDQSRVNRRFETVQAVSDHNSIVKYCAVIQIGGIPALVSLWHEATPLRFYIEEMSLWHTTGLRGLLSTARGLLWKLLAIVGHINKCGVVHGDISLDTILVKQLELDHSDIMVGGFSECGHVHDAEFSHQLTKDCLDVFKAVKAFLQGLQKRNDQISAGLSTRQGWLGHPYLDALWERLDLLEPWTNSTLDVCKRISLQLDDFDQPWRSLKVKRCFNIGTRYDPGGLLLNTSDLIEYIRKDAQDNLSAHERTEIDSAIRIHLKHKNHSDYCSETAFWNFSKHVSKSIDRSVGTALLLEIDRKRSEAHSDSFLSVHLKFNIRCYLPSHIINLTQLLGVAHSKDLEMLQPLLSECAGYYEVRGDPSLQGIYIPLQHLKKVADGLQLDVLEYLEQTTSFKGTPVDISLYGYQNWILLADTSFSIPARLNRTTRVVSWDGQDFELGTFLRSYMPLSALSVRPNSLEPTERIFDIPLPHSLATKTVTYDDSCQSEENIDQFKFRLGAAAAAKRTAEWLNKTGSTRSTHKKMKGSSSGDPRFRE